MFCTKMTNKGQNDVVISSIRLLCHPSKANKQASKVWLIALSNQMIVPGVILEVNSPHSSFTQPTVQYSFSPPTV